MSCDRLSAAVIARRLAATHRTPYVVDVEGDQRYEFNGSISYSEVCAAIPPGGPRLEEVSDELNKLGIFVFR